MKRPIGFMPRASARAVETAKTFHVPRFEASQKGDVTELYIYDAIGPDIWGGGVTAQSVADAISQAKGSKTLRVRINSPGGDVFDGVAIYNSIRSFAGRKVCIVDGLAASAASMIAMAGDEIVMAHNAMMMIHEAWGGCVGNADAMRKCAADLETVTNGAVLGSYSRTGNSREQLQAWMSAETWMSSEEALARKFCTSIDGPAEQTAQSKPKKAAEYRPRMAAASFASARQGEYLANLRRSRAAKPGTPGLGK